MSFALKPAFLLDREACDRVRWARGPGRAEPKGRTGAKPQPAAWPGPACMCFSSGTGSSPVPPQEEAALASLVPEIHCLCPLQSRTADRSESHSPRFWGHPIEAHNPLGAPFAAECQPRTRRKGCAHLEGSGEWLHTEVISRLIRLLPLHGECLSAFFLFLFFNNE